MRKIKIMSTITLMVSVIMIALGVIVQREDNNNLILKSKPLNSFSLEKLATSTDVITKEVINKDNIQTNNEKYVLPKIEMEVAPSSIIIPPKLDFASLSLSERVSALAAGKLNMEYSAVYSNSSERLTKRKGAQYYNGHRETYYSEKVLPGGSLRIPGRHVADDGTIRDGDGYICVAADPGYMPKGSVLITSLGPAKVYDTGCAYGTIDIYVSW